jgi:hypothetical protein
LKGEREMSVYVIKHVNWTEDLIEKIKKASDGDTIICHSEAKTELGKKAKSRMCPDKKISFVIK